MDGRVAAWINGHGGDVATPSYSGKVTERPLADGRTLITVTLRSSNAITYVWEDVEPEWWEGPMLFGHRSTEILAGAEPTYGSFTAQFRYITAAQPGDPMEDALDVIFEPDEGHELVMIRFSGHAFGPLREDSGWAEGTPGRASNQQVGLFQARGGGAVEDDFPTEGVRLQAVGR
jgi:hypothetical protein